MDREKRRQYQKAYYERNREKLLAKQRERGKRNYRDNPDAYKTRARRWREQNPERMRELQKRYSEENRETITQRSREWYQSNRRRAAAQARRRKLAGYGLTEAEYQAMLAAQGGLCAICRTPEAVKGKPEASFRVDHCHTTGAVRGLLCAHCNSGLGQFRDDPTLLRKAAAYLTRSSSGAT